MIVAIKSDSLLPLDRGKRGPELQEEALDLPQQRRLEILLAERVLEAEEIEQARILEHQVGSEFVVDAQGVEFLADEFLGLSRQRRAFVEQLSIFWRSTRVLQPSIRYILA